MQIEELRIGKRGVVVQNEPQGQLFRKLIIHLGAIQVIVKDIVARRKGRRHGAFAGSKPVIDQRLIKPETGRRAQRESQVDTPRVSQKRLSWRERLRGEEILSDSLDVLRGKREPFVRLGNQKGRGAVLAETDALEKFVSLSAADVDGCLLRQVHLKTEPDDPVLQGTSVVPVHRFADRGPKIDDLTFIRSPEIAAEGIVLADVDAIHEPQFGAEIGGKVAVVRRKSEMPAGVGRVSPQRIALLRTDALRIWSE